MTERITIDGEPLTEERFVEAYDEVAPLRRSSSTSDGVAPAVVLRDDHGDGVRDVRRRAGRRGRASRSAWAAPGTPPTSPTRAVAVITPIAVDHARLPRRHAGRDRRREGRHHQARLASRSAPSRRRRGRGAARARRRGRRDRRPGGRRVRRAAHRVPAVGGQMLRLQRPARRVRRGVPAAVRRAPGAQRRAARWPRSRRSSAARRRSTPDLVREAFAQVTSPGRLEVVRRSPTIVLDAAHNPHGAARGRGRAQEAFAFSPLIGVVGGDGRQGRRGRAGGVRAGRWPRSCAPRTRTAPGDAGRGARRAGARASSASTGCTSPRGSTTRIDQATTLAEEGGVFGEAHRLRRRAGDRLGRHRRRGARTCSAPRRALVNRSTQRSLCAAMLVLQAVVLVPDRVGLDRDDRRRRRRRRSGSGSGLAVAVRRRGRAARPVAAATRWAGRCRWSRSRSGS